MATPKSKKQKQFSLLSSFEIRNLGCVSGFSAEKLGGINVFLGENGCGKSYILKMLYVACKAMETAGRGDDTDSLHSIIEPKLRWTYQTKHLQTLGRRDANGASHDVFFSCRTDNKESLEINIDKNTGKVRVTGKAGPYYRAENLIDTVFLPAKEVLSSHSVIVKSRDVDRVFGFDETYCDLAKVLMSSREKGKRSLAMKQAREELNDILKAIASYDSDREEWTIAVNGQTYDAKAVSDGIRKMSILDILFASRTITPGSIIMIDEPETSLHPQAISKFMEAIYHMSTHLNIQFFLATHSYFVIKKLSNLAKQHNVSMPLFSYQSVDEDGELTWLHDDLRNGVSTSPVVRESVALYEEEINAFFAE